MAERQSTGPGGYILPSTAEETRRLERQARLYGGLDFLEPFLRQRPERILDVGCGSGHFTRQVAARLPAATVTGLDLDTGRLDFARADTEQDNLRYEQGDLTAMDFADDAFDLVFCRFVLGHQRDPLAALREMARVTRPGGQVVAYDMIHQGIWFSPPKPALQRLLAIAIDMLREHGAEPDQGLHLPVGLKRAGLCEVRAQVLPHFALNGDPLFDGYRENWRATVASLAQSRSERFDEDLVQAADRELEPSSDDQFLIETSVVAQGTKKTG